MGGDLTVDSAVDRGAVFRLTVKIEAVEQPLSRITTEPKRVVGLAPGQPAYRILIKVRAAPSGARALATIAREKPDLILLDIMMPELDGLAVCKHLQEEESTQDIPIIFISALDDVLDKVKAFSLGGVDYVTKPLQMEEVLARVKTHLSIKALREALVAKNACLERTNAALQSALAEIKTLQGILPICANCKKIRDRQGDWNPLEVYIQKHSDAEFSHGICPQCVQEIYPGFNIIK